MQRSLCKYAKNSEPKPNYFSYFSLPSLKLEDFVLFFADRLKQKTAIKLSKNMHIVNQSFNINDIDLSLSIVFFYFSLFVCYIHLCEYPLSKSKRECTRMNRVRMIMLNGCLLFPIVVCI